MAKSYRTRSTKGPGGTRRYTTQSSSGAVKSTMSYSTGSSSRMSISRNSNGSVTQRTTQKLGDGFTKRTTKTLVSKPKTPKAPKPPKMPKMKTTFVKESKPTTVKPYKAPKTPKPKPFKWPTSKATTSRARTKVSSNSSNKGSGKFFFWITVTALLYMAFVAITGITP